MNERAPVLRWLGTWTKGTNSPPSTPPSPSRSPSLVSLNEALREQLPLPQRPLPARLRHPPLLDSLTRTTLPTASISHPRPPSPVSPSYDNRIAPPRTSLDSLRSVSRRDSTFRTEHARTASFSSQAAGSSSALDLGWWFQSGNKSNVDTLLEKDDRADTVQEEQENIRKKYRSPKNPIVFCHGLLGFDSVTIGPSIAPMQVTHWRGIKEVLEANGAEVLITRVPATSSPFDRAKVLEQKISETYPGRSVHLIGHSMGGIDCRYLTTHLTKREFSVLSVTTIASPHRGSSFADHFLETLGRQRMPSFLQFLDLLPNGGGDGKAFECLTIESMRKFNENVPDVPGVKYFSWGAIYNPGFVDTWKWPHSVVLDKEGPNDGLVSVKSAMWGKYLGTLQDVNHLDLVGWINTARYKWAEMTGREIKFRPATFYLGIADMLAKEVEGQGEGEEEGDEAGRGADVVAPDSPQEMSPSHSKFASDESEHEQPSTPGETTMTFASEEGNEINHTVIVHDPPYRQ
ncbi:alpha/beta-hydrolase [Dendrothele bispora CBS 962.96]|uniref:GPI inositol-deacylase n=1 Tax=Dendrothele bispora (strain CBS 962.96) TaxID=1314807 RepID=A0A4S8MS92_DENBC|nr:alpha/beta-hydrolase [Dendrothele bispora CBS 962.96]